MWKGAPVEQEMLERGKKRREKEKMVNSLYKFNQMFRFPFARFFFFFCVLWLFPLQCSRVFVCFSIINQPYTDRMGVRLFVWFLRFIFSSLNTSWNGKKIDDCCLVFGFGFFLRLNFFLNANQKYHRRVHKHKEKIFSLSTPTMMERKFTHT